MSLFRYAALIFGFCLLIMGGVLWAARRNSSPYWLSSTAYQEGHFRITALLPDGAQQIALPYKLDTQGDIYWSPDGSKAVFEVRNQHEIQLHLLDVVTGKLDRISTQRSTAEIRPIWSADSTALTYTVFRQTIGIMHHQPIHASETVKLSDGMGSDVVAAWSPDGTRLAFLSNRTGSFELYLLHEGNIQQLTDLHGEIRSPRWSPDGKSLAFILATTGSSADLYYLIPGEAPRQLTNLRGVSYDPQWSPNGEWLLFGNQPNQEGRVCGRNDVRVMYRVRTDGTSPEALVRGHYLAPRWSTDGKWIYFNKISNCTNSQRSTSIYRVSSTDTTAPQQISSLDAIIYSPITPIKAIGFPLNFAYLFGASTGLLVIACFRR